MYKYIFILISLTYNQFAFSQNIPSSRITNWESPGSKPSFIIQQSICLNDYGADSTGTFPSDTAIQTAITALNGAGEIYVKKGSYLFLQTINLPDSIVIRGEVDALGIGPLVLFKLSPGENHGMSIIGSEVPTAAIINYALKQGEQKITVDQPLLFSAGDFIRLKALDDSLLVFSDWAYHSTGQLFQINQIIGKDLILNKPLRRSYSTTLAPLIYKMNPRKQVHIKCIKIERLNISTALSANIYFYLATDCSISGIESNYCNYAHLLIENSCRITVENSFFQNGLSYGDGGKAYGTLLQFSTGDCFIHQNIFKHLRHSMVLQAGANGNVFAYNYSTEPYWTETLLPANSAGDITLHGNYVYMNLFEGNIIQNIVIDNSHGSNGPFNTFYRNKAELWGIFMNSSPASDQQNFIGNQICNTFTYPYGFYLLAGNDHFEYGNMVKGKTKPDFTYEPYTTSMFNYSFGSFYHYVSNIPPIKNNNWRSMDPLIESLYRYRISEKKTICSDIIYDATLILAPDEKYEIYPNPFTDEFTFKNKSDRALLTVKIYSILGKLLHTYNLSDKYNTINLKTENAGMYFLEIEGFEKAIFKILKY
ncbi:MAG: T9SS type A sorting domain-containing protein [Bacteroidota bacterium]